MTLIKLVDNKLITVVINYLSVLLWRAGCRNVCARTQNGGNNKSRSLNGDSILNGEMKKLEMLMVVSTMNERITEYIIYCVNGK